MARRWPDNRPSVYASDKAEKLAAWWGNDVGAWKRAMWAKRFRLPSFAAFGFCSNGDIGENTGLAQDHAAFSEITEWGISAGPWDMPAPNRDTSVENNYYRLHDSARVYSMLGRNACMVADCWRPENGGLPDTNAIGTCTLEDHMNGTALRLAPQLRPTWASPYQMDLFCLGWSAGNSRAAAQLGNVHRVVERGGAFAVVDSLGLQLVSVPDAAAAAQVASGATARWADEFGAVPEQDRLAWIGRRYATAAYAGVPILGAPYTYDNVWHGWTRVQQKKLACAYLAQRVEGTGSLWLQGYESAAEREWIETVNALAAGGIDPRTVVGPRPQGSRGLWPVAVGLGAAALGFAGIAAHYHRGRR